MDLHAYFSQKPRAAIEAVAASAGTSFAYLQHCKYGNRRMSADLALWLEHVTDGELTARELRPDLPWPHPPPAAPEDAAAP